MNKEKAETLLENYQALSELYSNMRKELDRTRKALDVAVDALNTIKGKHDPRCAVYHIDEKTAYDALEQITALEQKDVK